MFDVMAERAIDWSRVAKWSDQLAAGDPSEMRATLREHYGYEPSVAWNPKPGDMAAEKLGFLLQYWNGLRHGTNLPRTSEIDPLQMRQALGHVMLIDSIEDGRDFRYRLYGSLLVGVSGFDMTGRLLSNHGASVWVIEFSLATYRAALRRREPIFTTRSPIGAQYTAQWHRVAMPLVDETGAVVRFLAGTVPLSRNGGIVSARI